MLAGKLANINIKKKQPARSAESDFKSNAYCVRGAETNFLFGLT